MIVAAALMAPVAAEAHTWRKPGGGVWQDGANWLEGVPPGPNDVANFPDVAPDASGHLVILGALDITLTGDTPVRSVVSGTSLGGGAITIHGGRLIIAGTPTVIDQRARGPILRIESPIELQLAAGEQLQLRAQTSDARIDLAGAIRGVGGVHTTATGSDAAILFLADNSYSGSTTITGGARFDGSRMGAVALAAGAFSTGTVALQGTLDLQTAAIANPIVTSGQGQVVGAGTLTGAVSGSLLQVGLSNRTRGGFVIFAGPVAVASMSVWRGSAELAATSSVTAATTIALGDSGRATVRCDAALLAIARLGTDSLSRTVTLGDRARVGDLAAATATWGVVVDGGATARIDRVADSHRLTTSGGSLAIGALDADSVDNAGPLAIASGRAGALFMGGAVSGDFDATQLQSDLFGVAPSTVGPGLPLGAITVTDRLRLTSLTTFAVDLRDRTADRLIVDSARTDLTIDGATLTVSALGDVDPSATFVIVDNRRPAPSTILGRFAGLPEGAAVTVDDMVFTITYAGGDGNDIALLGTVTCSAGDSDGDGQPDDCDDDDDGDGVPDQADDCPLVANADQGDHDGDLAGDACDLDDDGDGVPDATDTCPYQAAPQTDSDGDGVGDACDLDADGDGVPGAIDVCPDVPDLDQLDHDGDGDGDACDDDDDGDGRDDAIDVCPIIADPGQADIDGDHLGDACDADDDGDGALDVLDRCPRVPDAAQIDTDRDGAGDACDADDDGDGVVDASDRCPLVADPAQVDTDRDGAGDACDPDDDGDGAFDLADNCPLTANPGGEDTDGDGAGNACDADDDGDAIADVFDNCPLIRNVFQLDLDLDGNGDVCDDDDDGDGVADPVDNCPVVASANQTDTDGDGAGDPCDADDDDDGHLDGADNCPFSVNPFQLDLDHDGLGDVCDGDQDGDGFANTADDCPAAPDPAQLDLDHDGLGDVCDPDADGDGLAAGDDNCPLVVNPAQADLDLDGLGDACDADDDGDGVADGSDNCPRAANPTQANLDLDGLGDACDLDDDGDGALDDTDNCPRIVNPGQADNDGDHAGDACDADDDNDGALDAADNCPLTANPNQADFDHDGRGDVCDPDTDDDGVPSGADSCPRTPRGAVVDPASGCSLLELCPCSGPRGSSAPWRNHGAFVSCVAHTARDFRQLGLFNAPGESSAVANANAACR